jgi:hypothetical protein
MSHGAQALYFNMGMHADDDGFLGNPKSIMRGMGTPEDDFKILIAKGFVISFESGVIVIKHWRINNQIRPDRYKETLHLEEKTLLRVKMNSSYTLDPTKGRHIYRALRSKD